MNRSRSNGADSGNFRRSFLVSDQDARSRGRHQEAEVIAPVLWESNYSVRPVFRSVMLSKSLVCVLTALVTSSISTAFACGPFCIDQFYPPAPGGSIAEYPVDPGQGAIHLLRAYRELNGLNNPDTVPPIGDSEEVHETSSDTAGEDVWPEELEWRKAAKDAGFEEPQSTSYVVSVPGDTSGGYLINCAPDAFKRASDTLRERLLRYGKGDARLVRWYEAQTTVFARCSMVGEPPGEAETNWEVLERQDRAYQRAAALMYSFRHQEAYDAFSTIAADSGSPWSSISSYLALRVLKRRASLNRDEAAGKSIEKIRSEIATAIASGKLGAFTGSAVVLADYFGQDSWDENRQEPSEVRRVVGERLGSVPASQLTSRDFVRFLKTTRFIWAWNLTAKPQDISSKVSDLERWFSVMRCADDTPDQGACLEAARAGFRSAKSVPWALAMAARISPSDPDRDSVLKILKGVSKGVPAYASAQLSVGELAAAAGDRASAQAAIDELKSLPLKSRRLVYELEFIVASTPQARATPLKQLIDELASYEGIDAALPTGLVRHLNSLDTAQLAELSGLVSDALPGGTLLSLAFTRAVIARQSELSKKLFSSALAEAETVRCSTEKGRDREADLRCGLLQRAKAEYSELAPNQRRLAELFVLSLLQAPRPYFTRAEEFPPCGPLWWCRSTDEKATGSDGAPSNTLRLREVPWDILRTYATRSGAVWFTEEAIDAVSLDPKSPMAPALLSRVIWGARSACADPQKQELTKRAFKLLHSRYRTSAFADLTPVFF